MKKITFIAALLAAFTMNAQLFSDDFEDGNIDGWTLIDEDGDDVNFRFFDGGNGSIAVLNSQSWNGAPLTPDNYAISEAIDVTGATGLTLTYSVGGQDPDYSEEVYTAFVSTGNTVEDLLNTDISVSFNEDLGDDPDAAGALVERTLDASMLDGATTVYIAFRHHDVTDQFQINIDNVVLDSALSVNDLDTASISHYTYNNSLVVSTNGLLKEISISNLLGQQVAFTSLSGNEDSIDISTLSKGIYIASVSNGVSSSNFKFIVK